MRKPKIERRKKEMKTKLARDLKKKILFALTITLMASMMAVGIAVAASPAKGGFSGVVDFKQLATVPESKWIGSILQRSNSKYYEGMSVPQRVIFLDIASTPGDVHTLTFSHEATKGGIHAYDWLTAWNQGNDPPLVFDPCGPKIGPPKNLGEICQNLHSGPNCLLAAVPDDPFMSKDGSTQDRINAYELEFGNRQIRICGNQPITSASFTDIYHDVPDGGDTGDSYIHYVLTWTSASDQILIEMAGHLAMSGDPSTNPIAWGPGLGSSQIQGGPYHFKLHKLDELSLGSQDNQIMGASILMIPSRKGGYKWDDKDGDGVRDVGEPVLNGWTIQLYKWDGTTWVWQRDAVTGDGDWPDGYYEFTGLEAGDYKVVEDLPAGWICTCPGPSAAYEFTVISGFEELNNNFGNFRLGRKGGYKWDDKNGDGVWDDGEPVLAGWTINLYKWDGAAWVFQEYDVTDEFGYYEFTGLMAGTYKVEETLQDGWICTHPDPPYYEFTVTSGFSEIENNFYNFKLGVKAGYKWNDLDGDGVWDDGEPGLEGWTIQLWKDGVLFDTDVTDADGYYEFTGLMYGEYVVQEVLEPGWIQTYGDSYTFTCISGFEDLDNNFGNFELGRKGGYKWEDLDGDGVKEGGEPVLNGWTIQLYKLVGTDWVWQADAVTGDGAWPDGYYEFTGLEAGTYRVMEVLQAGWMQTYPAAGYHEFTVVSGFEELDNDFGNVKPPEHPPSFVFRCEPITSWVYAGQIKTLTFELTNIGDPESRVYYLTFTAVIEDYSLLQFVDPYTARIKVYYNDGTVWDAYVDGDRTYEKFAGFGSTGYYWMVTWRVPTTYPDGPYLEGNDGGALEARVEVSFKIKGKAYGITMLQFFPRATEDHHAGGVPLADIVDKANIWGNGLWYPVHNSYDPYDDVIGTGHSWDHGWEPVPTTDAYARIEKFVCILTMIIAKRF